MTAPVGVSRCLAEAVKAARGVRWYIGTLMGDRDYVRFVAHQRATHPGAAVPTEKEFWRQRWAEQERAPGVRCC
ncbi:YbdD/YjiX family protein [Georgenia yuyongxinii]